MGVQKVFELLAISASCCVVASAAGRLLICSWNDINMLISILYLLVFVVSSLVGLVTLEMSLMHPADSWNYKQLLKTYIRKSSPFFLIARIYYYWKKGELTTNPDAQQTKLLLKYLSNNQDTAYGKDYKLNEIKSPEEFIQKHPITEYDHYRNYCERTVDGEANVMTPFELAGVALSSGTTGKSKVLPISKQYLKYFGTATVLTMIYKFQKYSRKVDLRRNLIFTLFSEPKYTQKGVPLGPFTSIFKGDLSSNIVPSDCQYIYNESAMYHVMAVFSLREDELGTIQGFSSDLMFCWFQFIVENRDLILLDIQNGYISPLPDLEDKVRWKLNLELSANPDRADNLRSILDGARESLAMRIWPNLSLVLCARSGSYRHSAILLEETYLRDTPFSFSCHGSTESLFGWNYSLGEEEVFTMAVDFSFFEFIPAEQMDEENPKTVLIQDLKLGMSYEFVVTNSEGLYRYRMGDIIEINGFDGEIPTYKFKYRRQHILNIARTPDAVVLKAIMDSESQWNGLKCQEYTCCESFLLEECTDWTTELKCYVVFMELEAENLKTHLITSEHEEILDQALFNLQDEYRTCQKNGSIGRVKIFQVKAGTFDVLRIHLLGGCTSPQFKMPRVLRKIEALQLLYESRVGYSEDGHADIKTISKELQADIKNISEDFHAEVKIISEDCHPDSDFISDYYPVDVKTISEECYADDTTISEECHADDTTISKDCQADDTTISEECHADDTTISEDWHTDFETISEDWHSGVNAISEDCHADV